jgi:hypothetical protein
MAVRLDRKRPASPIPTSRPYASSWRIAAEIETHPAGLASANAVATQFPFTRAANVAVMVTLFPDRGAERSLANFLKFRESRLTAVNHTAKWRGIAP